MTVTTADVMRHIRNHFVTGRTDGQWTVEGGVLQGSASLTPGQWIAVTGGTPCDGVHQLDDAGAIPGVADGTFTGCVWLLQPPQDFLRLCEEIAAWAQQQPLPGLRQESFGAYSRTAATASDGAPVSWEALFRDRLTPWRRMFAEVNA